MNQIFSEEYLLNEIKKGNSRAFEQLFCFYYNDLFRFAYSLCEDFDFSKDLVQDAFSYIWEKRMSVVITGSLKSYLLKSIQNQFIQSKNRSKLFQKYAKKYTSAETLSNLNYLRNLENTYNSLFEFELKEKIEKIVNNLPPDLRETYELSRVSGFKNQEIAAKLNISEKAVEKRLTKILAVFRSELQDYLIQILILIFFINRY